ncbi:MAG: hypothetical protein ACEQR8_11295 [Cypionkella sp.]
MTWLAALVLVLAQGAASPAAGPIDPRVAAQVPLIAGKLADWRGTWAAVDGKLACRTVRSTGDEEIDKIGCFATLTCVKPIYPELKAIADGKATEADKKAQIRARLSGQATCLKQYRGQGIAELALKRGTGT